MPLHRPRQSELVFESKISRRARLFLSAELSGARRDIPSRLCARKTRIPPNSAAAETCNQRTICKYIHLQGARSCQLVMGVTHLLRAATGTRMPPHTHMRRSEIYMYFNLAEDARVIHLMGPADETRHIVMADKRGRRFSRVVDSRRRGHARLQFLLGHGRRESGLRRHGPRHRAKPGLNGLAVRPPRFRQFASA